EAEGPPPVATKGGYSAPEFGRQEDGGNIRKRSGMAKIERTAGLEAKVSAVECRLDEPITADFRDATLRQIIAELRDLTGLNMVIDEAAAKEDGIDLDQADAFQAEDVSLKSVLKSWLRKSRLTYVIQDGVLQITTERKARQTLVQKTYAVADLIVPVTQYLPKHPKHPYPEMKQIM